jgi:hypothetical protein
VAMVAGGRRPCPGKENHMEAWTREAPMHIGRH